MQIFFILRRIPVILILVLEISLFLPLQSGFAEEMMSKTHEKNTNGFSKNERKQLLQLARKTLDHFFETKKTLQVEENEFPGILKEPRGCFVTLQKGKEHALRGCIGNITPHKKLYEAVIDNAINAAVKDWRFSPLTKEEFSSIEIEISVLTVPKKLEFSSPEDLLVKIRPGIDGVYLFFGSYSSTYLPQVWEKLSDKKEFFSSLCLKGGAPKDCWKKKEVEIHIYQAEYFSESDY